MWITEAGHLNENAFFALALNRGFARSQFVDTTAHDLKRLFDGFPGQFVDRLFRQRDSDTILSNLIDLDILTARYPGQRVTGQRDSQVLDFLVCLLKLFGLTDGD